MISPGQPGTTHAVKPASTPRVATAPARQLRMVMAGVLLAMALAALDQNIVNTALPRMAAELGGIAHLSWVVTAFMLTSTTTTPLYGKLSDIYGRRMLFFVAIAVFLTGSILCGAAQSMAEIILFRALQGLGAGGLLVLAQAAIGDVVSPRERPRYQGLVTGDLSALDGMRQVAEQARATVTCDNAFGWAAKVQIDEVEASVLHDAC